MSIKCGGNMYCAPTFVGDNSTGTCQNAFFAAAGEACTKDLDCSQNSYETANQNMICTDQASCVPTLELDATCDSSTVCSVGLVCSPNAGRSASSCIQAFTKLEGQTCSEDIRLYGTPSIIATDCKVSDGVRCSSVGVDEYSCLKQQHDIPSYNCSEGKCQYSGGGFETCICESFNSGTGICRLTHVIDKDCQDSLQAIIDCGIKNKCTDNLMMADSPNSCLFQHCNQEICDNKCQADTGEFDESSCSGNRQFLSLLEEEEYVGSLSNIIQRDFFPDLPNLRQQLQWIDAVDSNDVTRMRTLQMDSIRRAATTSLRHNPRAPQAETPSTFDTPVTHRRTVATDGRADDNTQEQDTTTAGSGGGGGGLKKQDLSLDQFVATFTSEDDSSYVDLQRKQRADDKAKHAWMEERARKENGKLMLTSGSDSSNAPNTWLYTVKNQLMYYPEGGANTSLDGTLNMAPPKQIVHENTRITGDAASERPTKSEDTRAFESLSLEEQLARLQREGRPMDASALGFIATPSMTPSNLGGASPLMTWGRIDGTPMLLPDNPITTPLDIEGSSRGSFKIPDTPRREKLAHDLADNSPLAKVGKTPTKRSSSTSNSSSGNRTPTYSGLSPAAQKLVAMRSPSLWSLNKIHY
eukprot:gene7292-8478_t